MIFSVPPSLMTFIEFRAFLSMDCAFLQFFSDEAADDADYSSDPVLQN
jgi:hypothetical protein